MYIYIYIYNNHSYTQNEQRIIKLYIKSLLLTKQTPMKTRNIWDPKDIHHHKIWA